MLDNPFKLPSRSLIHVIGQDAATFLQGQISNDIDLLNTQNSIHALLLTPQGKILADLFIYPHSDGYLLELDSGVKDWLIQRFTMFKLRSDVEFIDLSAQLQITISKTKLSKTIVSAPDPRLEAINQAAPIRNICKINTEQRQNADDAAKASVQYHNYMALQAIVSFGGDYQASEHFPQDLWFDKLASVSFSKGCYVGQEVVSRMRHKSTARKRLLPLISQNIVQSGDKILYNDISVGQAIHHLNYQNGHIILAIMRIDKLDDTICKLDGLELRRPKWTTTL